MPIFPSSKTRVATTVTTGFAVDDESIYGIRRAIHRNFEVEGAAELRSLAAWETPHFLPQCPRANLSDDSSDDFLHRCAGCAAQIAIGLRRIATR